MHVEIFTGVEHAYDVQSIVKQNSNDVLLIVPQGHCSLDVKVVRKSLNVCLSVSVKWNDQQTNQV